MIIILSECFIIQYHKRKKLIKYVKYNNKLLIDNG